MTWLITLLCKEAINITLQPTSLENLLFFPHRSVKSSGLLRCKIVDPKSVYGKLQACFPIMHSFKTASKVCKILEQSFFNPGR